ncbi:MAG: cysteine--tRNA ligase [Bacteroidetes bacterium]|nr:cysteine--tRNA ligase [Bacteroidota bacterium]
MALSLYNSLTRRKEEFIPLTPGYVGMYVCGPTVYSHSHLGHAKSYVSFDVVVRYLRYLGYKVLYVQNITDVGHLTDDADEGEDKIARQARLEKVHPMQVAEMITRSYFEDMDALNVIRPDISPRASGHIPEQIELIERLLARGYAYVVNGSVYFDVQKFVDYGKLSGRTLEEAIEGTRVEVRSEKRHPADFALWKRAEKGHIMRWKSPWGEGYPGWHIECSAMSMKYLGESFDIHGGGMDNRFPHHECEIAQSEGATGKPFVKYWMHNNLVTVNGQKMSKSLGNFITLKDIFQKYNPEVVRFLILQSHYRSTLDFSDEGLHAAKAGYEKLLNTVANLQREITKVPDTPEQKELPFDIQMYERRFHEAMDDDFNTPQALAVLFELTKEVNQLLTLDHRLNKQALSRIENIIHNCAGTVLGLLSGKTTITSSNQSSEGALVDLLVYVRSEVRKQKLWGLSDQIRDKLRELGYILEDKRDGTTWRKS